MIFEEYLRSASEETRRNYMQYLRRFGEPNAVLRELAAIPPCVQNQHIDVRINHKYILWHQNKDFMVRATTWIYKMDTVEHCYLGYEGRKLNEIGLVGNNGGHTKFCVAGGEESIRIYHTLRTYIKGFECVKPASVSEQLAEVDVPAGIYVTGRYVLRNYGLWFKRRTMFGGRKEQVKVPDIRDILWCSQLVEGDSEGGNSYLIDLYFLSQRDKCRLYFPSSYAGYQFVLELKKRVPHLLYGYSREYEQLYQRDPARLLALGRNKGAR